MHTPSHYNTKHFPILICARNKGIPEFNLKLGSYNILMNNIYYAK